MKELDCQKFVCDIVRSQGGFAMKMSHRHLVGVPDLLVKLPSDPAMVLEAKWSRRSTRDVHLLDITPKQASTLRRAARSAMLAGVVSFLSDGRRLGVRIVPIRAFDDGTRTQVLASEHIWGLPNELPTPIGNLLRVFART